MYISDKSRIVKYYASVKQIKALKLVKRNHLRRTDFFLDKLWGDINFNEQHHRGVLTRTKFKESIAAVSSTILFLIPQVCTMRAPYRNESTFNLRNHQYKSHVPFSISVAVATNHLQFHRKNGLIVSTALLHTLRFSWTSFLFLRHYK